MTTETFLDPFLPPSVSTHAEPSDSPSPCSPSRPHPQTEFCLVVHEGEVSHPRWDLDPQRQLRLGRQLDNDLVIHDATCSRRHCRMAHEQGVWYLEDLGSRNGTLVNGERIRGEYRLCDGDEIQIGQTIFSFLVVPPTDIS